MTTDFKTAVEETAERLDKEAEKAGITHDPIGPVYGAVGAVVRLFPWAVEEMMAAARKSGGMSAEDRTTLINGMIGVAAKDLKRIVRSVRVAEAVFVAGLLTAAVYGAFACGRASGAHDVAALGQMLTLSGDAGATWLRIIAANPDPAPVLAQARVDYPAGGGEAVTIRIWAKRPTMPPPGR